MTEIYEAAKKYLEYLELLDKHISEDEQCHACGAPATRIDCGEPVCFKHTADDAVGVSECDFF